MPAEFKERFRVEPEHIAAEEDPEVLLEWRAELARIINEISFQLDTLADRPFVNERWIAKANGARNACFSRLIEVARRLAQLGAMPSSPSLVDTAAEAIALRRRVAELENENGQLRAARAEKVERAKAPPKPAQWQRERANLEKKVANLQASLAAAQSDKKARKEEAILRRRESVAECFVQLVKQRVPFDEFMSLISAAEVAARGGDIAEVRDAA